jgi:hypothetical protein
MGSALASYVRVLADLRLGGRAKRMRTVVSLIVVLGFAFMLLATSSHAASAPVGTQETQTPSAELEEGEPPGEQEAPPTEAERQNPNEPVTTLHEIPSLRGETSDTYLLSNGAYSQRIADHPINFKAGDGSWQPIEDQLVQQPAGTWSPQAAPVPFSLPSSLASGPVSIGSAGQQLSFQLEGASQQEGSPAGASRVYRSALADTDVTYVATAQALRETLTLSSADAPTVFNYHLSLASGLHATQQQDDTVLIENAQGQTVYTLTPPSATDANPDRPFPSKDVVRYELSGDGSTLSVILDKAWLQDPHRVFPVKIDPEAWITTSKDCPIISAGFANKDECGSPLYVGPDSPTASEGIARSLLYFDTSCVPKGSVIVASSLHLYFTWHKGSSTIDVEAHALEAHALEENTFTSGVTWNKYDGTHAWGTPGGDFNKAVAGERVIKPSEEKKELQIGFTPAVEQWVRDPTSNHGIVLKAQNETVAGYDAFAQSGNTAHEPEPTLEVIYEPRLGDPPMGQLYQLGLANGSSMNVNVANGNLFMDSPDVNYATESYDTELGRTYNSQDDLLEGASVGNWRLTKGDDDKLYGNEWDGAVDFYGSDGSDTRFDRAPWADNHPAVGDKAFTGEAGFNEGLTQHEAGTRTLTLPGGIEWKTDNKLWSIPTEIVDPGGEGNTLSLSYYYDSHGEHLEQVKDTHGHTLKITREAETHRITKIEGKKGEDWKYAYKEGRLITVTNPAKEKAKYTYYKSGAGSGLLESIADESGTWVVVYDEQHRVASLRKLVNGTVKKAGSEDEITTFSYETEQTTVTNPEGGKPLYYYDEFGNELEEPATQEAATEFYAGYAGIEVEAARKVMDLQDHAEILDSQLSEQLGGNYVGEWFDPHPGDKPVQIGIAAEGYEKTVEQDLDNLGLADNARVVPGLNSIPQLETAEAEVHAGLAKLESEGLLRIGIEPEANGLKLVEGNSLTSSQKAEVEATAGSAKVPVKIVVGPYEKAEVPRLACRYGSCPRPLRGGVRIADHSTECTAGFLTRAKYGHKPYLLTAGHCVSKGNGGDGIGAQWFGKIAESSESPSKAKEFEPQAIIGKAHSAVFSETREGVGGTEDSDESIIEIAEPPEGEFWTALHPEIITYGNSAFEKFGLVRNEHYLIERSHYDEGHTPEGNNNKPVHHFVVCMAGTVAESGTQEAECGMEEGFVEQGVFGKKVENLEELNACIGKEGKTYLTPGASGGPVYKNGSAYGILTNAEGCEVLYEGVGTAERRLHVEVLHG